MDISKVLKLNKIPETLKKRPTTLNLVSAPEMVPQTNYYGLLLAAMVAGGLFYKKNQKVDTTKEVDSFTVLLLGEERYSRYSDEN